MSLTVDEWFQRIETSIAARMDVDVNRIDERTVTFARGKKGAVLHAHTADSSTLRLSLSPGGPLAPGERLASRVQHLESRNYSIDELSVPHVANVIAAHLGS